MAHCLVVGDIHGCYAEFMELLEKAGLGDEDQIIALGDVVDRGPDSSRVLQFFRSKPSATSLMGNHERKHVRSFHGETRPALAQQITRRQLGDAYPDAIAYLQTLPYFMELSDAVLVHGFLEPGVPLEAQQQATLAGTLTAEKRLKRYGRPWYELYDGKKPVIVGHLDYTGRQEPFIYKDRVFGIDTQCCRGGRLTGILLPEFSIISVPARCDYWSQTLQDHSSIIDELQRARLRSLSWAKANALLTDDAATKAPASVKEQLAWLRTMVQQAEAALDALLTYIHSEKDRIIKELQAERGYEELPPQKQAALLAARIGQAPWAAMLHLACGGQLSRDRVKKMLKTPEATLKLARRLGLVDNSKSAGGHAETADRVEP